MEKLEILSSVICIAWLMNVMLGMFFLPFDVFFMIFIITSIGMPIVVVVVIPPILERGKIRPDLKGVIVSGIETTSIDIGELIDDVNTEYIEIIDSELNAIDLSGIQDLKHLLILKLMNNRLTSLPAEIGRLKSLRTLDLTDNHLTSLPVEICHLDLRRLDLEGNPLTSPPWEVAMKGINGIRTWFRKQGKITD